MALPLDETRDAFSYSMRTQGYYLFGEGLPDPELRAALRRGIDEAIDSDLAKVRSGEFAAYNFPDIVHLLVNRGDCFVELLERSPVQDHIDLLLGETCVLHLYNAVKLEPGRGNSATRVHRDSARLSPGYLLSAQVLYYIDDFTALNGATWVLPGSHHSAERPSDTVFFERAVQVTGPAGAALVMDSCLWHAGGHNQTDAARRGVAMLFTRSFMKQQFDFPLATKPEVVERLSERSRRLLGFNVRVPASLEQFMVPEDRRLYKGGQG